MRRPDRESRRILLEMLETVRALRLYWQPKAGEVHRVKVLVRQSEIPLPRPRKKED